MILEITIGECAICQHKNIVYFDGEAYICMDRDTCNTGDAPKEIQKIYIGKHGPNTSTYYILQSRDCGACRGNYGCQCHIR